MKWYVEDFPPRNSVVNFEDKTIVWKEGTIETIPKHAGHNCYTHIPVSLAWVPAEETVRRLRRILCTTYAGRDGAREIDEHMEVLALDGRPLPQK